MVGVLGAPCQCMWGKRTADEIIEGVKKFCEEHPYVDSKKIGCLGASYGGFYDNVSADAHRHLLCCRLARRKHLKCYELLG